MSLFIVDVESDGPVPPLFSMVSFAAIRVDKDLKTTFKGFVKPISDKWKPAALAVSNISREEHLAYPDPVETMTNFVNWVKDNSNGKPVFLSDNLAYDWQFINYYTHAYTGDNPFGFSGRRIGDIYSGAKHDLFVSSEWKRLRKTKHTHDPLDDVKGNAEAFLSICKMFNMKIPR